MFGIIGRDNESTTHREWTMDKFFRERENAKQYIEALDEVCKRHGFDITYYVHEFPGKVEEPVAAPDTVIVKARNDSPLG